MTRGANKDMDIADSGGGVWRYVIDQLSPPEVDTWHLSSVRCLSGNGIGMRNSGPIWRYLELLLDVQGKWVKALPLFLTHVDTSMSVG